MSIKNINSDFWQTKNTINMTLESKFVYLYILTSPHSNSIGCYYLPELYIANDTGVSIDGVQKCLNELHSNNLVYFCNETSWILCYDFLYLQAFENNKFKLNVKQIKYVPHNFSGLYNFINELKNQNDKIQGLVPADAFQILLAKYEYQYGDGSVDQLDKNIQDLACEQDLIFDKHDSTVSVKAPIKDIIALYHYYCPSLPKVRESGKMLNQLLRARYFEKQERQNLEWWENFFKEYIQKSDFLMGKVNEFQANLTWICRPRNFEKILNGNYLQNTNGNNAKNNNSRFAKNEEAVNSALNEIRKKEKIVNL